MDILFVRHGQSTANTAEVFANRDSDAHPLTPLGRRQVHALARRLAPEPINYIYSSPLRRARETATILARARGLSLTIAQSLSEYDVGEFEGRPYGGSDAWRMRRYEENEARWRKGDIDQRLAGGESLREISERLQELVSDLARRHGGRDTVVLVGHGGLFRVALPLLLENVTADLVHLQPCDHGAVIRVRACDGRLHCRRWGRLSLD
jgi:probable phosphoglycerate mutase